MRRVRRPRVERPRRPGLAGVGPCAASMDLGRQFRSTHAVPAHCNRWLSRSAPDQRWRERHNMVIEDEQAAVRTICSQRKNGRAAPLSGSRANAVGQSHNASGWENLGLLYATLGIAMRVTLDAWLESIRTAGTVCDPSMACLHCSPRHHSRSGCPAPLVPSQASQAVPSSLRLNIQNAMQRNTTTHVSKG